MRKLLLLPLIWLLLTGSASRDFDSTGDFIDMGDVLNVTTGDYSLCIWVNPDEDASEDRFIGRQSGGTAAGYGITSSASTDVSRQSSSDGTETILSAGTLDLDGLWTFTCGTFLASTETNVLYTNGVQQDTDSVANVDSLSNAVTFRLGAESDAGAAMDGRLAYGMQFSAVLTVVEINELMWKPESIVLSAPNGFWPIWGDASEIDLSANDFVGTPTNTTASALGPPVMFGGMQ